MTVKDLKQFIKKSKLSDDAELRVWFVSYLTNNHLNGRIYQFEVVEDSETKEKYLELTGDDK